MGYIIISTIVLVIAAIAVANGVGMRRAGKRDEGALWVGGAVLGVLVVIFGWGAFRSFHSVDAGHVLVHVVRLRPGERRDEADAHRASA